MSDAENKIARDKYSKNRPQILKQKASYYQRTKPIRLANSRKRKLELVYRMSEEDYNTMFSNQHGACAICGKPETGKRGQTIIRLCVDHNHVTGKVRGLLCRTCNTGLGAFNSDIMPEMILKAYQYLMENK